MPLGSPLALPRGGGMSAPDERQVFRILREPGKTCHDLSLVTRGRMFRISHEPGKTCHYLSLVTGGQGHQVRGRAELARADLSHPPRPFSPPFATRLQLELLGKLRARNSG